MGRIEALIGQLDAQNMANNGRGCDIDRYRVGFAEHVGDWFDRLDEFQDAR
jgi:hypothetical protein